MTTEVTRAIQKAFLASPFFAVVGASKDQSKYGTKVRLGNACLTNRLHPSLLSSGGPELVQSALVQCDTRTPCNFDIYSPFDQRLTGRPLMIQKEKELEGISTITSISELPSSTETSISIITPPKVNIAERRSCSLLTRL